MKEKAFWIAAAAILLLDRASKLLWAQARLVVWPGVLALNGTRNTGMAFGLLQGNARVLAVVSILLMALVLFLVRRAGLTRLQWTAVGLMLGGALGNLIDRAVYGYVIDFIEALFVRFYIFNIADAGVTCGALLLAISLIFTKESKRHEA